MNRAYLSLGSNIDPEYNLPAAVQLLGEYGLVLTSSHVWESRAVDDSNQPNYLNAAVLLETHISARLLRLQVIRNIEHALGRTRDPQDPHTARVIDIDIMLFNRDIIILGQRKIPDEEIMERAFVALPLAEIDPDYIHPENGQTLTEIADGFVTADLPLKRRDEVHLLAQIGISNSNAPPRH